MTDKKHAQYVYRPAKVDLADESIMVVDAEYGLVICSSEWADDLDLDDPEHDNLPELNAALIAEAFNVATETGKTPRQLAESNAELVDTLEKVLGFIDSGIDMAIGGFDLPPEPRTPYDREACEVCSWLTTLITKAKAEG